MTEHASHEDPELAAVSDEYDPRGLQPTEPVDVLTPFLEGTSLTALGDEAEQRMREQLRDLQVTQRQVLDHVDETRKLMKQINHLCGKIGEDCETAARSCFDVWEEDDFLYGYICGLGVGMIKTSRLLSLIGNVVLIKHERLKAEVVEQMT